MPLHRAFPAALVVTLATLSTGCSHATDPGSRTPGTAQIENNPNLGTQEKQATLQTQNVHQAAARARAAAMKRSQPSP